MQLFCRAHSHTPIPKVLRRQEKEKQKQKNQRTSKAKAVQPRSDAAEPEKAMANPFASAAKKLFRQKKNAPAKMYPASPSKGSSVLPQTAQYQPQRQRSSSMYKNSSTSLKHHSSYSPMDGGAYSKLDSAYSTLDGTSGYIHTCMPSLVYSSHLIDVHILACAVLLLCTGILAGRLWR